MRELSFYDGEALIACLQAALSRIGASPEAATKIKELVGDTRSNELNRALVDLCQRGLAHSEVEIMEEPISPSELLGENYMRLGAARRVDGQPEKMLFIRVRDVAPSLGIELIGLAIALLCHSPSAIASALLAMKTLYDHASTLKSPDDDHAMRAYEALLRYATSSLVEERGSSIYDLNAKPTVAELTAELKRFGVPDQVAVLKALKRLREVRIADVAVWGGAGGDVDHPDNRWECRA